MPHCRRTVIKLAHRIEHFLVEDAKTARAFLKQLDHPKSLRELSIVEIGHAPREADIAQWLAPLRTGVDIAVLSEAGCPAIADPGATLVAAAHRNGWKVQPLVGPSSIMLALMASGLNGQRFRFVGYLPIAAEERAAAIRALESKSKGGRHRFLSRRRIETSRCSTRCCSTAGPTTRLAVAVDLTGDRGVRSAVHRRAVARSAPTAQAVASQTTCRVLFACLGCLAERLGVAIRLPQHAAVLLNDRQRAQPAVAGACAAAACRQLRDRKTRRASNTASTPRRSRRTFPAASRVPSHTCAQRFK